jgi:hypothetical protein
MGTFLSLPSDPPSTSLFPTASTSHTEEPIRIALCFAYLATHFDRHEFLWSAVAVENRIMDTLIELKLVAPNAFPNLASLSWCSATCPETGIPHITSHLRSMFSGR